MSPSVKNLNILATSPVTVTKQVFRACDWFPPRKADAASKSLASFSSSLLIVSCTCSKELATFSASPLSI